MGVGCAGMDLCLNSSALLTLEYVSVIKVLLMNMLDKIIELPKITLKELEQQARNSHPAPRYCSTSKENSPHTNAIVVVSPFYQKLKQHPSKCECQFHRLKKTHRQPTKHFAPREQKTKATFTRLNSSDILQQSQCAPVNPTPPYILNHRHSPLKGLQPLIYPKNDSLSVLNQQPEKSQTKRRNSEDVEVLNKPNFKQRQKEDQQLGWKREKTIDTTNLQFIALISRRLENDKYKSGYLKTLFSYIRMKTNMDKFYMWHSKAYLANSLNILLNHFTMEKLVRADELEDSEVQRIAFYMACQNKQVRPILKQLGQAVNEMQAFLTELKSKQEQTKHNDFSGQEKQNNIDPYSRINSSQKISETLHEDKTKESTLSRRHSKINIVTEQSENDPMKRSTKGSFSSLRKSILKSTLQFGASIVKTIDGNLQSQQKSKKDTNQHQVHARHTQMISTLVPNTRSTRSTVFATINECRGQSRQSTVVKKGKQAKQRQKKLIKLPSYVDPYQKYSGISYERFCSKKDFMHLVDQLQRLDQNEEERAQKMFHILNAEQFIDDTDKLDLMVSTFSPLLNQKCKEKLLRHIVLVKDRRYIQKLSHQLDYLLAEVKRTDPRNFSNQDLCPYRQDSLLKNECHQRIIPLRQSRQQHTVIIKKMAYHQNLDKVSKNRLTQGEVDLQLEQRQLSTIRCQPLDPVLSRQIYHLSKPKKDTVYIKPVDYTNEQQRKILQYMRQKHPNTFQYLNNQISTLCSKLVEQQQPS